MRWRQAGQIGILKPILVRPKARIEGEAEMPMKGRRHTEEIRADVDAAETRLASCAIAALVVKARRESLKQTVA